MAANNLKPKVKPAATEAEMAKTNLGMQDRIKLDNKLGKLTSTEKKPKKGDAKLVGPD